MMKAALRINSTMTRQCRDLWDAAPRTGSIISNEIRG
jgi:hypothetical protein